MIWKMYCNKLLLSHVLLQYVCFCMSNKRQKSVLVICPQGKYPYLPSYVHIFPPNSTSGICAQWHRKELLKVHALGVFPPMYRGTGILKSFIYRQQEILFKTTFISFNHVNNVMNVYTQPGKPVSLSDIIKRVYDCIHWELNVSEYVAIPRPVIFSVTLWHINMS